MVKCPICPKTFNSATKEVEEVKLKRHLASAHDIKPTKKKAVKKVVEKVKKTTKKKSKKSKK